MNGKKAKRLRREAGFNKQSQLKYGKRTLKLESQYNITIGCGSSTRVIPVEKWVEEDLTEDYVSAKTEYKKLKKA